MSDLISKSETIDLLYQVFEKYSMATDKNSPLGGFGAELFKSIKEMPTTYDVDMVVTELNELDVTAIKRYMGGTFGNYEGTDYYIKKSDAIEIVKHGGISDDVCEWEKGSSGYVGYPAYYSKCCTTNSKGLEMQTHIIADWKFCPYCGKKIKIVGD